MIYENLAQLNTEASGELFNGKLEVVLFNEELARRGLAKYTDYLSREPNIGAKLQLAIVEGSTLEFMKIIKERKKESGVFITDLLDHMGNLPTTNLKEFGFHYLNQTSDAYLPMLKLKNDKAKVSGIAFFKEDKYVYRISLKEGLIFKMLTEDVGEGEYMLKTDEFNAAIQNVSSSRKYEVDKSGEDIKISVVFEGVIKEYTGNNLANNMDQVTEQLKEKLEQKANELVKRFQEENIDPIGLGEQVRSRQREFRYKQWEESYPSINITVEVEPVLTQTGVKK
ncbi:Ger(x)C family spore germination protein [Halobacillus shinanisalinarum]|uniref:Ger(X)C family spore germination protein n=1 Tax=Halobacillus shinanisalinarum TaxID=2932258 RepID=A0ABY4GYV3_9BACI|nr:Ger(x)C family spore germination protein [Halobacillus shinanisalinarum]UOQ93371.1 Ger(x)C family spore germination protein [Halobacillus shinanisalinarum]